MTNAITYNADMCFSYREWESAEALHDYFTGNVDCNAVHGERVRFEMPIAVASTKFIDNVECFYRSALMPAYFNQKREDRSHFRYDDLSYLAETGAYLALDLLYPGFDQMRYAAGWRERAGKNGSDASFLFRVVKKDIGGKVVTLPSDVSSLANPYKRKLSALEGAPVEGLLLDSLSIGRKDRRMGFASGNQAFIVSVQLKP